MKKILIIIFIILIALIIVRVVSATQYDWILGEPVQTDNTNFDWVLGVPYIIYEVTEEGAPAPTGMEVHIIPFGW